MKIVMTGETKGAVTLSVKDIPNNEKERDLCYERFLMRLVAHIGTAVPLPRRRRSIRNLATLGLWEVAGKPSKGCLDRTVKTFDRVQATGTSVF